MVIWRCAYPIDHRETVSVHRLIELGNVEELLRSAERFTGGNGLVSTVGPYPRSILKFSSLSVGEVFGYQIATALGVRVARMQGFWTREAVNAPGTYAEPGRIGVLVEHLADWRDLGRDYAASQDADAVTRALSLCAFDCSEWGSFGESGEKVYFADLERLSPLFDVEGLLAASDAVRTEMLGTAEGVYAAGTEIMIDEVIEEADRLGLRRGVARDFRKISALRPETYSALLTLVGHPLDELISRFSASLFGRRVNAIAGCVSQPMHKVPAWR